MKRTSIIGLCIAFTLSFLLLGCQSNRSNAQDGVGQNNALTVYVTKNAQRIREKAADYGLNVQLIDNHSQESKLIQVLLKAPHDKYFVVINPFQNNYITGGAVNNEIETADIENLFQRIRQISDAGVRQVDRLQPSENAKARIVVFSDFQCPYCSKFEPLLDYWQDQYGDQLEVEFVHYPLPSHTQAFPAAEAAECARAQGQFDAYKKGLFTNQRALNDRYYLKLARELKLDTKKFKNCTQGHFQKKAVKQDQYFGEYLGVQGTPSLFLNGENLAEMPKRTIEGKIHALLHGQDSPSEASAEEKTPEEEPDTTD